MHQNYYKRDQLQSSKSTQALLPQKQMQPSLSSHHMRGVVLQPEHLERISESTIPSNRPSLTSNSKMKSSVDNTAIEKISINFQQQCIDKQRVYDNNDTNDRPHLINMPLKYIIRLQAYYRRRLTKKVIMALQKRQRYRKCIVNELVLTERQYLRDIVILCMVQQDLKDRTQRPDRVIGTADMKTIFQNIDAIKGLSKEMLDQLESVYKSFNGATRIGGLMKQFASFFKFYFEYCNNFQLCQKAFNTLKKDNSKFKDYIQSVQKEYLGGQLFESFLIKPVQRVPKYVLLLKDLLKNTSHDHCDYKDISQALEQFIKVNEDNNKNMDKVITNQKIFELQKLFGDKVMIVNAKRVFKSEESLKIFHNHDQRSVIVYFLTDLVLVTEREESVAKAQNKVTTVYRLLKFVFLDQNSYSEELEDTSNICYLFRLIGKNETVTFIADDQKNKVKFIVYLNNLIDDLKSSSQSRKEALDSHQIKPDKPLQRYPILVKVLGTQEVQESSVKAYTQYVISVEISNIVQKIFLRFSQFVDIQKEVKALFPKLKLPYFKDQNWLSNHDVKVIEGRKLQMMDFLQTLLTSEEMENNGGDILKLLCLPLNFYTLPELLQDPEVKERTDSRGSMQQWKYGKRTITGIGSSRTSSVFQNYYSTDMRSTLQSNAQTGISPRVPVRPQPTEEYLSNQVNKKLQEEVTQQLTLKTKGPTEISGIGTRSNSQQQRKFSATKLTRGSLPINSMNGSMVSQRGSTSQQQPNVIIKIQVHTFPKPTDLEISISPETRGGDAFEDVMMQVGLETSFDFKLYIQERVGQRPIEEDELLWQLLVEKQTIQSSTTQKLTQLVKKMQNFIYSYNQKPVLLKKHLYLPEQSERENFEDTKRVELIASQTFVEIQYGMLKLNDTEYTMFTALRLFLDGVREVHEPFERIQEFLPLMVFKSLPKENWLYVLPDMINGFEEEVKNILQEQNRRSSVEANQSPMHQHHQNPYQNQIQNQHDGDGDGEHDNSNAYSRQLTASDAEDEAEKVRIGQLVFLKLIAQTQFYGLKIFEVTPDKETRFNLQKLCQDQFKQFLLSMSKSAQSLTAPQVTGVKLKLCVGYSAVSIYTDFKQTRPLVLLNYDHIQQLKAHPLSLVLHLQPEMLGTSFQVKKAINLHFDTGQSFVIQMLIEEYKQLRQTIQEESAYMEQ